MLSMPLTPAALPLLRALGGQSHSALAAARPRDAHSLFRVVTRLWSAACLSPGVRFAVSSSTALACSHLPGPGAAQQAGRPQLFAECAAVPCTSGPFSYRLPTSVTHQEFTFDAFSCPCCLFKTVLRSVPRLGTRPFPSLWMLLEPPLTVREEVGVVSAGVSPLPAARMLATTPLLLPQRSHPTPAVHSCPPGRGPQPSGLPQHWPCLPLLPSGSALPEGLFCQPPWLFFSIPILGFPAPSSIVLLKALSCLFCVPQYLVISVSMASVSTPELTTSK